MTPESREAMEAIAEAFGKILNLGTGLSANFGELVAAVHVLQSFVKQHELYQVDPDYWNNWFESSNAEEIYTLEMGELDGNKA